MCKMPFRSMVLLVLVLSWLPTLAKPIPTDTTVYTDQRYQLSLGKFYQRTFIEAYRQAGVHDPKWDADALRFLRDYMSTITEAAQVDLLDSGQYLVDVNCTDPLVLYCYATGLEKAGRVDEAEAMLRRSLDGFKGSKYPPVTAELVPMHLCQLAKERKETPAADIAAWQNLGIDWMVQACTVENFQPGDQRILLQQLAGQWDALSKPNRAKLCQALQTGKNIDPYIGNVVRGRYEIELAWDARGGGYADTVNADGWKGFKAHLGAAAKLLLAAWNLHPGYPEAPTEMIGIAMAGEAGQAGDERLWFDRAVDAQMDYLPAYKAYEWALRPRWGGSYDAMFDFGVECLKTKRFDTRVPDRFLRVLYNITSDSLGGKTYWLKPETYPYLATLFQGYAGEPGYGSSDWCHSMQAAAAWYCQCYPEAKGIIDQLGDKFDDKAFGEFCNVAPTSAKAEIAAMASSFSGEIHQAETLGERKLYPAAAAQYERLIKAHGDDGAALPYLQRRLAAWRLDQQFEQGEWVDLRPDAEFDDWSMIGEWTVSPDGVLTGKSVDDGLQLVCEHDFGQRLEFRAKVDFVTSPYSLFNAALLTNYTAEEEPDFTSFIVYLYEKQAGIRHAYDEEDADLVNGVQVQKSENTLSVQLYDDKMSAFLNGKLVRNGVEVEDYTDADRHSIGIGGNYWYPGATLRFSNLQIRKLTKDPFPTE